MNGVRPLARGWGRWTMGQDVVDRSAGRPGTTNTIGVERSDTEELVRGSGDITTST